MVGSVCLDWQKEIEAARRGGTHLDEGLHLDGGDRDLAIALCAVHITDADAAAVNETLDDEGVANGDALRAHAATRGVEAGARGDEANKVASAKAQACESSFP